MASLNVEKKHVLPSEFYTFQFENSEVLNNIKELVKKLPYVPNQKNCYCPLPLNDSEDNNLKLLNSWFEDCVEYVRQDQELPFDKIVITQMWANKAEVNEWHQAHFHANSYLSAVFYLTDSENGLTWFSRENEWYDFFLLKDGFSAPANKKEFVYKEKPRAGKLIIFPSNVLHSVEQNMDLTSPRYTIAFNSFPEGVFEKGGKLRYLNLKVIPKKRHEL